MSENTDETLADASEVRRNAANKVSDIDLLQSLVSSLRDLFKQQIKTFVWVYVGSLCSIVLMSFLCLTVRGCDFQIVGRCPCCAEDAKITKHECQSLRKIGQSGCRQKMEKLH